MRDRHLALGIRIGLAGIERVARTAGERSSLGFILFTLLGNLCSVD